MDDLRAHSSITHGFPIDSHTGEMIKPVPAQHVDNAPRAVATPHPPLAPREILQNSKRGWSAARTMAAGGLIVVLIGAAFILGWML